MHKGQNEQERLQSVQVDLYQLEQMMSEQNLSFDDLSDLVPGFVHLNSTENIALKYISPDMAEFFEKDMDEINAQGVAFNYNVVHPNSAAIVVPTLMQFINKHDEHQVVAYFQYMRKYEGADYHWFLTLSKIRNDGDIFSINTPVSAFGEMENQMRRLLDENLFMKKNYHCFARLTKREKQILKWLTLGESNQMIAERLFISKLTVKTHRRNITAKLETNRIAELIKYAQAFGL